MSERAKVDHAVQRKMQCKKAKPHWTRGNIPAIGGQHNAPPLVVAQGGRMCLRPDLDLRHGPSHTHRASDRALCRGD
jgi:hypothetical protein